MPQLEVHILHATNLPKMDAGIGAKSDPYVKLKVGETKYQTTVKEKTLDPVYNERFVFSIADVDSARVKIQMLDRDILTKDDKMGKKESLSLRGLEKGKPLKRAIKVGPKGILYLEMTALDFDSVPPVQVQKREKFLYFHTPVDEQGNNDCIEQVGIENEVFDTEFKKNYLNFKIVKEDEPTLHFSRSFLYERIWFREMVSDDGVDSYLKSFKNEEGLEEFTSAQVDILAFIGKEKVKPWKDMMYADPTTNEKEQIFFISEFLDNATGKYYAVYCNKPVPGY